ncbi:MAG TPA: SpoIIE family protein phosphatase [Candidatus Krumholzibacteria bacterium]|nr:SpoIIE family protein phosphatase [Candidatus Krumholzibacteria bacterium]HPD73132.1 SpoIIE family protein phosphatase [Candidatus Krumholzibacteria bacterium]HRY41990.1 SpoIIE family protein phosphatase [Candidatus Krumholzibacteria bacterium]
MVTRRALTTETKYRLLLQIANRIRDTLDLDRILGHLLEAVRSAVGYDAAGIFVRYEDLIPAAHRRPAAIIAGVARQGFDLNRPQGDPMLNLGLGIVGDVIRTGEPAIVADVRLDSRYVAGRAGTRSEIVVPIICDGRAIGAVNLESDQLKAYDEGDIEILRFFADAAAIVIQRAVLHRRLLDQRRLDDQLQLAQEVQAGLLPAGPPAVPGYTLAGRCIPTFEIGGDCFDYIPLPDGRLAVVVADVSGKGIPAALVMASFRALVRARALTDPEPNALAEFANRELPRHHARATFVTAIYGILDPVTGTFRYVNCGHNPPLLVRADGTVAELFTGDLPLGAFGDVAYHADATQLGEGDVLAIYTDGVVENSDDEFGDFGTERLVDVLLRHRDRLPHAIVESVVAETRQFHGISTYPDDFTLMVIRRERSQSRA